MNARPVSVLLCALGGEGGGVLSGWLVEAARVAGFSAQATSIPGVAQRTGATTYYLEVLPQPVPEGSTPVLGLNPLPGRLDLLVSSELLETVRQIGNGMASAQRTRVISNAARVLTTAEKMVPGDGRVDAERLKSVVADYSLEHHLVDMSALTREASTVISAVMLGCIAASGVLPMRREHYEAVIAGNGAAAQASRHGFALGHAAMGRDDAPATALETVRAQFAAPPLATEIAARFPAAVHPWVALGLARVREFQGESYARLYLERLRTVCDAERAAQPGDEQFAATAQTARWLAVWMAFDDVIRVAALKVRPERFERVRREVGAQPDEIVRIFDHFKPGVPEFAGLLPEPFASRLIAWEKRRVAAGKPPWSLPLRIATHSIAGGLALKTMACLRFMRPWGSRYQAEQRSIEQWLAAVVSATRQAPQLGLELARCGRLIKGYGSTNERGKRTLEHILEHAAGSNPAKIARREDIANLLDAALKDEAGQAFDQALRERGLPPRPVPTRPVLWLRNPRTGRG